MASAGDAPLPVDIGGGAAKVKPATVAPATFAPAGPVVGEFRLGPGNDPAPGVVRVDDPGARGGRVPPRPGQRAAGRHRRPVIAAGLRGR